MNQPANATQTTSPGAEILASLLPPAPKPGSLSARIAAASQGYAITYSRNCGA